MTTSNPSTLLFQFDDIGSDYASNEIVTNNDGSIGIKSNFFKGFWRQSDEFRWGFVDNPDDGDKFWAVKVNENTIALRHVPTNTFCYGITPVTVEVLVIGSSTMVKTAQFGVEEAVVSREIYDVTFRLSDARIYDQNVVEMATGTSTNMTSVANEDELSLTYTNSRTSTWNASLSLTVGVSTTFKTGIPIIAEGEIDISVEFTGSYEWGETKEDSTTLTDKYTATVPPMTEVKVSLMATKGMCDVPFSYTQRDTLYDGRQTTTVMTDGMYTGINCYNFYHEAKETKL